jgi:hypothetical protein
MQLPDQRTLRICQELVKAVQREKLAKTYKDTTKASTRRALVQNILKLSKLEKNHFGEALGAEFAQQRESYRRFLDWHLQTPCTEQGENGKDFSTLVTPFDDPKYCELVLAAVSDKQTQTTEGKTMSISIELTSQTLLNGKELANYTNQELYRIISKEEGYIAELKAVKAKPKRLVKEIEQRQAKLEELVALLDKQDGEDATQ